MLFSKSSYPRNSEPRSVNMMPNHFLNLRVPMASSIMSSALATCAWFLSGSITMSWNEKRLNSSVRMTLLLPRALTTQSISTAFICISNGRAQKSSYVLPSRSTFGLFPFLACFLTLKRTFFGRSMFKMSSNTPCST